MAKLSEPRRRMLKAAKSGKPGQKAGAYLAIGRNMGGATRRMMEQMIREGLLEKDWPWKITPAGRAALAEDKP